MQPDSGADLRREEQKNSSYADYQVAESGKKKPFAPPPVKCADIKYTDNAGQIGNQDPDQRPKLTEKRKLFIDQGM
jgi:hypothetical protein